jgi:hypothetical protein
MSWSVGATGKAGEIRAKLRDDHAAAISDKTPAQEAHVVQYAARAVEAAVVILPEDMTVKVESSGSCSVVDGKVESCSLSIKVEPVRN